MNIMILAPHQDDEILSSVYFMQKMQDLNYNIHIIFITNGNYKNDDISIVRYKESLAALKICNIESVKIYYMGYEDTGMRLAHSFLWRLYHSVDSIKNLRNNRTHTWHPTGEKTIHMQINGEEALFTRDNFLKDLWSIIMLIQPKIIVMPSLYDCHGDHKAVSLFVRELFYKNNLNIQTLCYLIHIPNEKLWPQRNTLYFQKPDILTSTLWEQRVLFKGNNSKQLQKKSAIKQFFSQNPYENEHFLVSFAKREEFFLPF